MANLFRNIAYNSDILYINVDKLVSQSFNNKSCPLGELLRNEYQLRANEQVDKHSAQTYSPTIVVKIVKRHIDGTNQEYKDFMLVDYPRPKK